MLALIKIPNFIFICVFKKLIVEIMMIIKLMITAKQLFLLL